MTADVALLVLTDGRDDLLARTLVSAKSCLDGRIGRRILHTDAGDDHAKFLRHAYPGYEVIGGERLGFGGAIARAWDHVAATADEPFVFHLEDDFVFNRPIPLEDMAWVLAEHPHIAQMALRRQPWNDIERAAGGVVESRASEYTERSWRSCRWLEHRLFWTTNPSLYHTSRCVAGWPVVARSEGIYSAQVFADPEVVSAFWGSRDSGEWCRHIGETRVGRDY